MKCLIVLANLVIAALIILSPLCVFADSGKKTAPVTEISTAEYRVSDNMVTHATGRTQLSSSGETLYEYKARIYSAPSYVNGDRIDTTWYSKSATEWSAGNNLFTALVSNGMVSVTYDNSNILWSPQVFVGGKEQTAPASATLLAVDPDNHNYTNNILSWDYGVCERRLRLIEGEIIETYVFKTDPGADVQIKSNIAKDNDFTYSSPVFAYDAAGHAVPISADKTVKAADLKTAVYPVIIDPTDSFTTSSNDCYWQSYNNADYGTVRSAGSAATLASAVTAQAGQDWVTMSGFYISRAGLYFDTSALPDDADITSAKVWLYISAKSNRGTYVTGQDTDLVIQNGQPTYPSDTPAGGDYNMAYYNGSGGTITYANASVGSFNNISVNGSVLTWIDPTGITKLIIRSDKDISGSGPPSGGGTAGNNYNYVQWYTYEQGAGYQPYLEVTYLGDTVPTLTTSAASYVAKTTARLNGLVVTDGGETANVSFNYQKWYSAGWNDCIEFTINHAYVTSNLTNFPILITGSQLNTTDTDFWASVNSSGSDILFTDANKVKLNRELVSINTTAQTMECYVNVTSVSSTTDTKIYMYYNSANIALYNDSNSTATWDKNYVLVLHMNDNPNTSTVQDSTIYNNDGVKKGAGEPLEASGSFSGDKTQIYDMVDDKITVTNTTSINNVWDNFGTLEIISTVLSQGEGTSSNPGRYSEKNGYQSGWSSWTYGWDRVRFYVGFNNTDGNWRTGDLGAINNYTCTAIIYSSVNVSVDPEFYYNGSVTATEEVSAPIGVMDSDLTGSLIIGNDAAGAHTLNGSISEYRLSNTSRSATWESATYTTLILPTIFCSVTDVFTGTSAESKTTGKSFYSDITGLTGGTLYAYKTEGVNSYGSSWGSWVQFTTSATCAGPTNMSAYPNATAVELVWQKGVGSSSTIVRYKEGSYPSSTTDGDLVYNGSSSSYIQTGLTPGTNYYYRAWADDGTGTYSANYSAALVTTFAGDSTPDLTPEAPTAPSGWFGSPHYQNMANMPFYDLNNAIADSIHMPYNTFWMGWAISVVVLGGIIMWFLTKKNTLIAILTSAVLMALFGTAELISWWYVGIYLIGAIALSYKAIVR